MPWFALVLGFAALVAAGAPASAQAASDLYEVRSIETASFGVAHPTTLSFSRADRALRVGSRRRARRVSLQERALGAARGKARPRLAVGAGGARFVLDRSGQTIRSEGRVIVRRHVAGPFRAIAFNPADGLIHALGPYSVVGFDTLGRARSVRSLAPLGLADPRAIAFAPTGDPTDAAANHHLYVADRGTAELSGRIVELASSTPLAAPAATPVTEINARHVQMIPTSVFAPSAPDPASLAYVAATDRFIVADSEVEEMPIYQNVNLWSTARNTTTGVGVGTTNAFSKEPAGLGYNPADGTLFVSDDDTDKITVDLAGTDGVHGTADDVFTRFNTPAFGSTDPEGVEYDSATGDLFVCDGIGLEVYRINPVNGVFGDAGDVVTSFDLATYGMRDCEGIGIDPQRSTLLAVDPSRRKLFELSKAGALQRIVDLNAMPAFYRTRSNLASVTVAPSSDPYDSPTATSYWFADRQQDNGPYPNENDGLLHEYSLAPATPPPADAPPTVSLTSPSAGATVSGTISIQASAADDEGLKYVQVRIDGTLLGTDADGSDGYAVGWDTTTVSDGSHTITVSATDSAGQTTTATPAQVTVGNQPSAPQLISVLAKANGDDATEYSNTGAVQNTGGDLELGSDQGIPTTTGTRFSGVPVPHGSTITRAWVQFTTDELDRNPATITVRGEASDTAAGFTSTAFGVSSRPVTAASVAWSPPTWTVFGAAGDEQKTADVSSVVQEIVNRQGWVSGNALALLYTGTGRRTAESVEGGFPPQLFVEFVAP